MNKNLKTIKRIMIILLMVISLTGLILNESKQGVEADSAYDYVKKGNGSYLTYRGSSEKVITLKEYNNPIQQYRACWISHFAGDLHAYQNEEQYKAELTEILENMESWGMNAMVFHIRTHNNAMYDSKLNPRARWWQLVDFEEFDPLEWLIDECHKRGIEFHAWMNPYRVLDSNVVGEYPEGNPALNPEYILSSNGSYILDPSSQVVRDFIVDTCMEVIENYDVDAIHFDDYFYISGVETDKSANWKREQVNLFIEQLHNEMTNYNEQSGRNVQLGISPSGIYRNSSYVAKPTYDANGNLISPVGSYTAGMEHYAGHLFSDTLHWINEEWIDYITPQSYWGLEMAVAGYGALTRWWSWATTNKDVNLYMGMGIYMAIDGNGSWPNDQNEVKKQLLNAGVYEEIDGICVYKYASLLSSNKIVQNGVEIFKDYWSTKRVPSAVQRSYADKVPSYPVSNLCLIGDEITWDEVDNVRGYMVYKVPTGDTLDKNNIDHLVEYTQDNSIKVNDTGAYDYYVSTVNKANVIGEPIKLETGSSLNAYEIVINRINALPTTITLEHEIPVNNVVKLYENLSDSDKQLVTNYNVLQNAQLTISNIKTLDSNINKYLESLDTDLVDGVVLKAPENMYWTYKNASDATAYNITTGQKLGTYLAKKITLTLTANVPNSNISKSRDVTFNISVIGKDYISLIYRNDASCMTPYDDGEYGPNSEKYIGWSNHILYVGSYALPIATGNYFEITDPNNLSKVHWTSCGGLFVNKTSSSISFKLNSLFESETPKYGYFIIGSNNLLRVVSDTADYNQTMTLNKGEAIFVSRYLERIMDSTPFTSLTTEFNTSTKATIEKVDEKINTNLVDSVILVINQLPKEITLADKDAVDSAYAFYNTLSEADKAKVSNYDILKTAVEKINQLTSNQNALQTKKEEALKVVNTYVNLNNYSTVNISTIKGYQSIAIKSIENALTIEDVNSTLNTYKTSVDGVKTIAQELVQSKERAKEAIKTYVSLDNYSPKQQENIKAILATSDSRIEKTNSFDELNEEIAKLQTELSNVMNLEQELTYLKGMYKDEIFTYYKESDYPAPSANAIASRAIQVSLEIMKTTSIDQLEKLVSDFKEYINDYLKLSELANIIEDAKKDNANLVGSSDKYLNNENVKNLLSEYNLKLDKALTKQEIDTLKEEFSNKFATIKSTIDAQDKEVEKGCKLFAKSMIALMSALSLGIIIFRKK